MSNDNPNSELLRYQKAKALGRKTVLFICTANAVRSQMAEALVNHFLGDQWAAFSAGLMPIGIHPMVVKVLQEIGVDSSAQRAKNLELFTDLKFDKVITLCSEADEVCTYYPGLEGKEPIPFEDPSLSYASFFGGKGLFRALRDEMKKVLIEYLGEGTDGKIS
ncbi:MAG: arsenate reductase ArsC [Pseudomonadota bacterium]